MAPGIDKAFTAPALLRGGLGAWWSSHALLALLLDGSKGEVAWEKFSWNKAVWPSLPRK